MAQMHWTGQPFVDAGLAALLAAVRKDRPEDLTAADLDLAASELERVLLSDQALGIGVAKGFSGPKKSLLAIFPNSELDNPSNWKGQTPQEKAVVASRKFQAALSVELDKAKQCLLASEGTETCFACGEHLPAELMETRRKDRMPLLEGIVNYYPAFAYGMRVCGLCALSVRFLPLSVMRIGGQNRLWFLHTQSPPLPTMIARRLGWDHLDRLIAANESLDFFGSWETFGDSATLLALLCQIIAQLKDQLWNIYESPLPTTAYVFNNDNRGGFIQAIPVPHTLLRFLNRLSLTSRNALERFEADLLKVNPNLDKKEWGSRVSFVQDVARRVVSGEAILPSCLKHEPPRLFGGWIAHRLYLKEVRGMSDAKLALLERLGLTIAQGEDAQKQINQLRKAERSDLWGVLLGYVYRGWLTHEEYYNILPPNDPATAYEVRDILLAVIYEWQHHIEQNIEFPPPYRGGSLSSDETLARIQQIGSRLLDKLGHPARWTVQLQTARHAERIRGVYLQAIRTGAMSFADFVFLAPLEDRQRIWLMRDYLLAFLFEHIASELPEDDAIAVGDD